MNEVVTQRPTRTIANVPDGMQPMVLAKLVQQRIEAAPDDAASIVFVARDGRRGATGDRRRLPSANPKGRSGQLP